MPAQKLLYKKRYETVLNEAMHYSMEFDLPDEEINAFISYIGKANKCDRFYIFEDSLTENITVNTYEYCAPGIQPEKDNLQRVDKDTLKEQYEFFNKEQPIVIPNVAILQDSNPPLYELLHMQGIRSMIASPLISQKKLIGCFGVDNPNIDENSEIRIFLSMASSFIVSLLRRRDAFRKMQKAATIKSYQHIAQIYLSMHRVNIQDNTFETIKTHEIIESNRPSAANRDFQRQIWAIADATVTEECLENVKTFTNLSTLDERMEDSIFIEHEFLSKTLGWCRQQFIAVNRDEQGHILHAIYTTEVINDAKKRENHLRYLAQTDMLTGLHNRGSGEQKIKDLLDKGQQGFLAIIDCDRFKSINDTYGHMVGDQVLIALAEAIAKGIHKGDIALRLGGDEFAIFMINIENKEKAKIRIQQVFDNVNKIHIPQIYGHPIHISMGVTFFYPESPVEFDHLYQQADKALYESKRTLGTIATFYEGIK